MESVEKAVAKSLMDIKAVMLRPDQPFVWASGWHSPIYCDNRRILSFPEIRQNVCTWMADIIKTKYPDVEVIAGVATGAIAHGYLVAHILGKPFCYVRPKPKDHGTGSQIEGILAKYYTLSTSNPNLPNEVKNFLPLQPGLYVLHFYHKGAISSHKLLIR